MRAIGQRLDTLYSAIEMLESGTTTVHHIHSGLSGTPENWGRQADEVIGAYGEIGMRAGFSFMIRDQNLLAYEDDAVVLGQLPAQVVDWLRPKLAGSMVPTRELMDFFVELKRRWSASSGDRVRFNLAPANLHWCNDETLQLIFDTARANGANVHMHLVETERQADYARQKFGHSAVAHLDALDCLGPELTLGHGNWMSRADLDLLAEHHCSICHNASSGLRLGSGIAPVNEMRRRGIKLALGIDQSNINDDRDMTEEMRLVWALHRETGLWNDRPTAGHVLQMATEHGARTAGFPELGVIEVGRPSGADGQAKNRAALCRSAHAAGRGGAASRRQAGHRPGLRRRRASRGRWQGHLHRSRCGARRNRRIAAASPDVGRTRSAGDGRRDDARLRGLPP